VSHYAHVCPDVCVRVLKFVLMCLFVCVCARVRCRHVCFGAYARTYTGMFVFVYARMHRSTNMCVRHENVYAYVCDEDCVYVCLRTAIIRSPMEAGPYVRVKNACAAAAVMMTSFICSRRN